MKLLCSLAMLLGALALAPASLRAQDDDTSRTQEARTLFEAGRLAYDAGRFESALDSFRRAHELSGRPALLFNMGSAHERLRQDQEAIAHYERYLREMPEAENREFVQSRIDFLRSAQRPDGGGEAGPAEPAPSSGSGGGSVLEEWWFWTILAVVVVGAGVGIGLGVALSDPGTQDPIAGNFADGVAAALVRF